MSAAHGFAPRMVANTVTKPALDHTPCGRARGAESRAVRKQKTASALSTFLSSASSSFAVFSSRGAPNEQRLPFVTRNGTPWDANVQRKRRFRSILKKLNIRVPKGNGFHAFRHANAALMDWSSVPMKVRKERLGHSNSCYHSRHLHARCRGNFYRGPRTPAQLSHIRRVTLVLRSC